MERLIYYPGFDASVLCEFRARLLAGDAQHLFLDTLLTECTKRGLLKAGGKQRTDSTHVLGAVRALNRYELVVETMRATLDDLAVAAPDWLKAHVPIEWAERYTRRADKERLPEKPEQRKALAEVVGADGVRLLAMLSEANTPPLLQQLPLVKVLRRVWLQNYQRTQQGWEWRETDNIPPATCFLSSPYDTQAHLAKKGSTCWVGYKVHLTESCEEDLPPLITTVQTTAAPVADGEAPPLVHQALQEKALLPKTHIVDTGYLDAALLVSSQKDFHVDLLGPTRRDLRWQARAGQGFDVQHFGIDWEKQQATCPAGRTSLSWTPAVDKRVNEEPFSKVVEK
jgi:transposase